MIEFEHITKKFGNKTVIDDFSLKIKEGNLVCLIGESGCGKTTALKMINRLVEPTSGRILIDGKPIHEMDVTKLRRNTGYVIQQTGLFPHMSVRENIESIPRVEHMDSEELAQNTINLLKMVDLDPDEYMDAFPNELSGGQQQRVGVARGFANHPDIILMDEPFSALDPMTRSDLQDEVVRLEFEFGKTIVFVTHDMSEAIKIADMICIMADGKVLQYDTPENILKNPANEYVEGFVGKNRIWSSPKFIKVADVMDLNPATSVKEATIFSGLEQIKDSKVQGLTIIEPHTRELLGVVAASEMRLAQDKTRRLSEININNVNTLRPEDTMVDALKMVKEKNIATIPVVDENNILVGVISKTSLIASLSQQYIDIGEE